MVRSFSVRNDITPISAESPVSAPPRSTRFFTGSDTTRQASAANLTPGTFRVAVDGTAFDVQLLDEDCAWVTVGTYSDPAVADEIVRIANSTQRADDHGPDRDGGRGSHPRTAVPLSTILGDFDDPSKSEVMAHAQHVPNRLPETELQALMESAPFADMAASQEGVQNTPDRMADALATLTPKQLDAFLMHTDGMSFNDIATRLGAHRSTVQGHVERARKRLAEFYGGIA